MALDHSETGTGVSVFVSGERYPAEYPSITITDRVFERSTAKFTIPEDEGLNVRNSEPVEIYDADENLVFAGFVDQPEEKQINDSGWNRTSIRCKDNHYLADKKILAWGYVQETSGDIVEDIWERELEEEGVTLGTIDDGVQLERAEFGYVPVSDALDSVAERNQFVWYITHDRVLNFHAKDARSAPFDMDRSDAQFQSISLKRRNPKYRNQQWIPEVKAQTDERQETLPTDGETQNFPLGFPVREEPTVLVNNDEVDVDVKGSDSDADFFYRIGDEVLNHNTSKTPLSESDTLVVQYRGEFNVVVRGRSEQEIDRRRDREGVGTGVVEQSESHDWLRTGAEASGYAQQLIQRYGGVGRQLTYETKREGLEAGQLQTAVNLPQNDINNRDMLITEVRISDQRSQGLGLYEVKAIEGPIEKSWANVFYEMEQESRDDVIRENVTEQEDILILFSFERTRRKSEERYRHDIFELMRANDDLHPGFIASFALNERVEYVALGDGKNGPLHNGTGTLENERDRFQVTKVIDEETGAITHRTTVPADQANYTVREIAWFGGSQASLAPDSGVMVEHESVEIENNSTIALLLEVEEYQIVPQHDFDDGTFQNWDNVSGQAQVVASPESDKYLTQDVNSHVLGANTA